jgi:capsid assembly protease
MKAPLIHLASQIFNTPLAIEHERLETILHIIGPRLGVNHISFDDDAPSAGTFHFNFTGNDTNLISTGGIITSAGTNLVVSTPPIIQLQSQNGDGDDSKPYKLTPEGIAVIPIRGTLMKRFSFLSSASGLTTYQGVAQAVKAAMDDLQVKAILFDVDSPGGTTHGCFELSDALRSMRGGKPMWACANDLAASAGYALASAADRVWLTRTAGVGSVGVFALHMDQSGADEQAGVKFTYIFAGRKKTDGNPHEPLGKSARSDIQAEVDREYDMFVACVAYNRGFAGATAEKIQAAGAEVFYGDNAVASSLADEVGTFDEACAALTAKVNGSKAVASGKLALQTEAGNNAPQPAEPAKIEPPKEGVAMAKLDTDETNRAKNNAEAADAADAKAAAVAAAPKKDDEDDDDKEPDDDDDDKPKETAKGKGSKKADDMAAASYSPKRIAELCIIGGVPELAAEFIAKGLSVEKVIEKLSARRAKASEEGKINSFVAGDGQSAGGQVSVDAAIEQARVMSANSGGTLSQSKCLEKIIRANPEIYSSYMEEKNVVASKIMHSGGGRALNEYVLGQQRRYLANLGLSTSIEDMPARRSM